MLSKKCVQFKSELRRGLMLLFFRRVGAEVNTKQELNVTTENVSLCASLCLSVQQ